MPEGDTIHHAARRIGAALVGREIEAIETHQPRHALDRWPKRQACRRCGAAIRSRGQGEDNRTTDWCPTCQA